MKIEYERKTNIPFEDVAIGEVFEWECSIYMRVDSTDENGTELDVNALDFSTGELKRLPSYVDVEILDAILKINTHAKYIS